MARGKFMTRLSADALGKLRTRPTAAACGVATEAAKARWAKAQTGYTPEEQAVIDRMHDESGSYEMNPDGSYEYRR